jgi:hypothetical protein
LPFEEEEGSSLSTCRSLSTTAEALLLWFEAPRCRRRKPPPLRSEAPFRGTAAKGEPASERQTTSPESSPERGRDERANEGGKGRGGGGGGAVVVVGGGGGGGEQREEEEG